VSLTKVSPSIETALRSQLPDGGMARWPLIPACQSDGTSHFHILFFSPLAPALLDVVLKAYSGARKYFDTLSVAKRSHEVR
jgi:hypothetical protein